MDIISVYLVVSLDITVSYIFFTIVLFAKPYTEVVFDANGQPL